MTPAARQFVEDSRIPADSAAYYVHCERLARARGQTVIDLPIAQAVIGQMAWGAPKKYLLDSVEQ